MKNPPLWTLLVAWCFMSLFDVAIIERAAGGAAAGPVLAGAVAGVPVAVAAVVGLAGGYLPM